LQINLDGVRRTGYQLLSYPEIELADLRAIWPDIAAFDDRSLETVRTEARYAVYLGRQAASVSEVRKEEERRIPSDLAFDGLPGLSRELQQKLRDRRPTTIAEAQRIDGMTPAALAILLVHIRQADSQAMRGAA
jgi:tRNA uridine 5-carboxymethylaminomethyl modification enzyme